MTLRSALGRLPLGRVRSALGSGWRVGLVVFGLALLGTSGWAVARARAGFPHNRHAKVFPTCVGCHEGVRTDDTLTFYPPAASCADCHDGKDSLKTVEWSRPAHRPTNLAFSHVEHAREADSSGTTLACSGCHAAPGTDEWMVVTRAEPDRCLSCHTHKASEHLADDNLCETCHVPLAQARDIPAARVARFREPPSHSRPDWASDHKPVQEAAGAQCATCHARETCARCHPNVSSLRQALLLAPDPRVAQVVAGKPPKYPTPASHARPAFHVEHGKAATPDAKSCANCHTRSSCTSCHTGPGAAKAIAQLPKAGKGIAPGVVLRRRADWSSDGPSAAARVPRSGGRDLAARDQAARDTSARDVQVHPPAFAREHGAQAAGAQLGCAGCHAQRFCSDCHQGEGRRRFHAPNFVAKHAAESYGRERDCSSCHNPEVFCRDCHQGSGLAAKGRLDVAFHSAQPQWLLQHGRAARQGLQSCTSCHRQLDCMQCHSKQGWGVSPHGPDFDAGRMSKRAKSSCALCHPTDPTKR